MNKNQQFDLYKVILVFAFGIFLGVAAIWFIINHSTALGVLFILANIFALVAIFAAIKNSYTRQTKKFLTKLTNDVNDLSNGESSLLVTAEGSNELKELLTAIERLRLNLKYQNNSKDTIISIVNVLAVNIELSKVLEELLPCTLDGTKSNWGAFYIFNSSTNKLELKASQGFSKNLYNEFDISIGEGYVGSAAQSNKIEIITDIPEDTVFVVRTFLGKVKPRALVTVPIHSQGELMAVLVLASIHDYSNESIQVLNLIRYYIGIAVSNSLTYEHTQRLTSELKFQNELIQNMNEELEQKVLERTNFLDGIINSITDYSIIAMDRNGIITKWNKGAETIRGYEQDEVIGLHISDTYSKVDKEKVLRRLEIAEKKGRYAEFCWQYKKDGSAYYADIVITAMYDSSDELIGFTNVTKDITAIRNLEMALLQERAFSSSIFKDSTRALLYTDTKGEILSGNIIAANLFGCSKPEQFIGLKIEFFFVDPESCKKKINEIVYTRGRKEWVTFISKSEGNPKVTINATYIAAAEDDKDAKRPERIKEREQAINPNPDIEEGRILFYLY